MPIVTSKEIELGQGNLNLNEILALTKENGVETAILEMHNSHIDRDVLKSMQISLDYLKENQ